ncbi:MAG: XdhC family protein [Bacteroidetes bacterium]|nr:XdhC family protein [Bacteroidota bacterium]MCL5027332.1 XdhC family protein [Chloroflexota bacterium]
MASDTLSLQRRLVDALRTGRAVAVATIARTEGSTPQKVGADILVTAEGEAVGTVGGGSLEAEVCQRARALLECGGAEIAAFGLTEEDGGTMVCGGRATFLIEAIPFGALPLYERLLVALEAKEPAVLARAVDGPAGIVTRESRKTLALATGETIFLGEEQPDASVRSIIQAALADGQPRLVELPAGPPPEERPKVIFVEPFLPRPTLLVVGAGHVGQAISRLAKWLDFEVVVLDNRPQYVTAERFPDADTLIVDEFVPGLQAFPVTPSTYVVLVTRGHDWDEACLKAALGTPASYVGMIGSRSRVAVVLGRLREAGLGDEQLAKARTPIGLDIGAVTVEEIALSILAEITAVRRGGHQAAPRR